MASAIVSAREIRWSASRKLAAIVAIAMVGAFDLLFRLGRPDWSTDELFYRNNAWDAFHGGLALAPNSPPPLAKHIIGTFEILFGRSVTSVRMSAVVAGILTGAFLALIARRIAGDWAAIAAAAVWFVLPHPGNFKLERYALLDIYMAMFATLAILFAVYWGENQRWRWTIAAGAAIGAATACKLPGALVLAPIGVYFLARDHHSRRSFLATGATAATAGAAFVAAYVPYVRQMPKQLEFMLTWQNDARARGHAVMVAGRVYVHPPWWAQFRWQWDASWILAVGYAVIVFVAIVFIVARRETERALLVGALATIIGFFAFISRNILHHYPYAWAPVLAVVVGLTLDDAWRRGTIARAIAIVIALAFLVPAAELTYQTAGIHKTDYAAAATLLQTTYGSRPRIVVNGYGSVLRAYLPSCHVIPDAASATAAAVVLDPVVTDRTGSRGVSQFVLAHAGEFHEQRVGRLSVYLSNPRG